MKKYQMAFHLFCLSLLLSAPSFAGVLNLQFIDVFGKPIRSVTIVLTGNTTGSLMTDADGRIAIQYPSPSTPSFCFPFNDAFYPEKPGFRFEFERGEYALRIPCNSEPVINRQIVGTDLPPLTSVSAADYQSHFTSDMIASAFGDGLAAKTEAATLPLKTTLGGRSLLIKDAAGIERPAQMLFVSPTQINYIAPTGLAIGLNRAIAKLVDENGNVLKVGFHVSSSVSPSLFTADASGRGAPAAAVVRASSGYQVYESVAEFDQIQQKVVPATIDLGPESEIVVLALFGTGWRQVGALSDVHINIGGIDCPAEFAGKQTTVEGLDQINVRLPRTLIGKGDVTLQLDIGGARANPVQLKIK